MAPLYLSLKALSIFKLRSIVIVWTLFIFLAHCSGTNITSEKDTSPRTTPSTSFENSSLVTGQINADDTFQSLQLYQGNNNKSIPSIELNSNDYLTLRFDELASSGRMFRVRVTHRNADWTDSGLMPGTYLKGFQEDYISNGTPGSPQEPHYVHYRYRFPNDNLQFQMSGNYLVEISDYENNETLFSLPFFVYEKQGVIDTRIDYLYNVDPSYFRHHQPFVRYRLPSFVTSPHMDLSIYVTQNRFWGRAIQTTHHDTAEFGHYRGYLDRSDAFIGSKEYRPLRLQRYDDAQPEIVRVITDTTPFQVFLFRDVVNLDVNPRLRHFSYYGTPRHDTRSRYVKAHFELQYDFIEDPIVVYGSFNNWSVNENYQLHYRASTGSYHGSVLVKEGEYIYKYAVIENGRIDDVRLDASFASSRQEYTTAIYYRDPMWQADRLLHIDSKWTD